MLHTPAELHVREAGEGEAQSRTITGYAILFNTLSAPLWADDEEEAREVIAPEAITKELLDGCDIKMTMFHDRQLILARSNNGAGTLTYTVDERGVAFSFDAPNTADGDKALELVRRGDISGCSFAFRTHYYDRAYVERSVERKDGKTLITYTVRSILGVYDFTLAADPAYPDTNCETEARELVSHLREQDKPEGKRPSEKMREQVQEMRRAASRPI
ncbi:HK97 family phage prohead protease [Bacteroides acidifaciens]|nr:HK97 family phage prohead protease [Bacteroides acidifaciens]